MGERGRIGNCFLRFSVIFCGFLRLQGHFYLADQGPNLQKSAKIFDKLPFLPLSLPHLALPDSKRKTHKHFSDGPCGTIVPGTNPHPSQIQTGQNGNFTVEFNGERPVCPADGSRFVPGQVPVCSLSGPVRDTPPYRAIPFRDSIAEGGIAPVCLVFKGYRAIIAEIPLLRGGYRTSTLHALQGGNAQKRGRGYRTRLAMLRHQKPHSAQ